MIGFAGIACAGDAGCAEAVCWTGFCGAGAGAASTGWLPNSDDRNPRFFGCSMGANATAWPPALSPCAGAAAGGALGAGAATATGVPGWLEETVNVASARLVAGAGTAASAACNASDPGRMLGAKATASGSLGSVSSMTKAWVASAVSASKVEATSVASDGGVRSLAMVARPTGPAPAKPNGTSVSDVEQEARRTDASAARTATFLPRGARVPSAVNCEPLPTIRVVPQPRAPMRPSAHPRVPLTREKRRTESRVSVQPPARIEMRQQDESAAK